MGGLVMSLQCISYKLNPLYPNWEYYQKQASSVGFRQAKRLRPRHPYSATNALLYSPTTHAIYGSYLNIYFGYPNISVFSVHAIYGSYLNIYFGYPNISVFSVEGNYRIHFQGIEESVQSDFCIDDSGYIYILHNTEGAYGFIAKHTSSSGAYITSWGAYSDPPGPGEFFDPYTISASHDGYIYVYDGRVGTPVMQKFTPAGVWQAEYSAPFGYLIQQVHDSANNIYMLNPENKFVYKTSDAGVFITQWGGEGTGDGEFYYPHGIACDLNDFIYVVDYSLTRVQKFTSSGVFVAKWGSPGTNPGQFISPSGICCDESNNVYVADSSLGGFYSDRIQKFDSSGNFISQWVASA